MKSENTIRTMKISKVVILRKYHKYYASNSNLAFDIYNASYDLLTLF